MTFETATITGAGSGLGRAFCEELGRRRCRVVASDIDEGAAAETAARVVELGGDAVAVRCDVAVPAEVDALAARARAFLGEVDLVVNNAGVAVSGPVDEISLADWQWIVGVNLWGVVHGCRAFVPAMKARGRGYIINVASAAGLVSTPLMAPYNVTKAGVVALSETLHAELGWDGIHVTALCPTFFRTSIARSARGVHSPGQIETAERWMARSRVQAPDVARAALAAVAAGRLYAVPMADGRAAWRLKRINPQRFHHILGSRLARRLLSR